MNLTPETYEEFLKLAHEGTVVPVVKRVMADLLTPVAAYLKIERLSPHSFLLESVEGGEKVARYSFLGFNPETIVSSRAGKVTIKTEAGDQETDDPMLFVLRRLSGEHIPVRLPDLPPFVCGAVGYMSYDAVRWFEKIPDNNTDDLSIDDAVMMFFSRLMVFDHEAMIHHHAGRDPRSRGSWRWIITSSSMTMATPSRVLQCCFRRPTFMSPEHVLEVPV